VQRERFLHSDEEAPHIHIEDHIEDRIVKLLGDLAETRILGNARICERAIELAFSRLICAKSASVDHTQCLGGW